jgi:hypothetical protein
VGDSVHLMRFFSWVYFGPRFGLRARLAGEWAEFARPFTYRAVEGPCEADRVSCSLPPLSPVATRTTRCVEAATGMIGGVKKEKKTN